MPFIILSSLYFIYLYESIEACPHGVFFTSKCNTGFANLDRKVHVVSCIGLFGRYSYTTGLFIKILNVNGIRNS